MLRLQQGALLGTEPATGRAGAYKRSRFQGLGFRVSGFRV